MAVDAHHLKINNHFPQHLLNNSHMLMSAIDGNNINMNMMMYNNTNHHNIAAFPISGATTVDSHILPVYGSSLPAKNVNLATTSMKDDSGLTYAVPAMMNRKRAREDHSVGSTVNQQSFAPAAYSFLGEDVSVQILQQQLDIDRFIYQHMEKVRMEVDERRRRNSRRMIEVVEEGILKRLKAKEDEIEKVGRLNWALEERVRSLTVENQIWRELAQTNEATANALRSNLEQVLAHVNVPEATIAAPIINLDDDAESCCGSSSPADHHVNFEEGWRTVPKAVVKSAAGMCKGCGKAEANVVMLTCRHMCLCAGCGSTRNGTMTVTCPVCKSVNNATLLVNL